MGFARYFKIRQGRHRNLTTHSLTTHNLNFVLFGSGLSGGMLLLRCPFFVVSGVFVHGVKPLLELLLLVWFHVVAVFVAGKTFLTYVVGIFGYGIAYLGADMGVSFAEFGFC